MPQTVIITGASRGIGLAAAEFMLGDGARVVAVHRSSTKEFTALLNKYPNALRVVQGDFTKEATVKAAIDEAQKSFGGVDSIVLNAAVNLPIGSLEALPLDGWQQMFDINLFGVVTFVQGAIPALRKSGNARIVLVSSEAANLGIPGMAAYSASKAALNSLNRTIAAEELGVTSVALHPGAVRTERAWTLTQNCSAKPMVSLSPLRAMEPPAVSSTLRYFLYEFWNATMPPASGSRTGVHSSCGPRASRSALTSPCASQPRNLGAPLEVDIPVRKLTVSAPATRVATQTWLTWAGVHSFSGWSAAGESAESASLERPVS
ncbi:NAD(P)-binding protein [Auricularia subglabra TFB-10046 SS5]|nr:NAD(P)-binding protein [Auricularia subglabra TFB-10046 SS5]